MKTANENLREYLKYSVVKGYHYWVNTLSFEECCALKRLTEQAISEYLNITTEGEYK